MSLSNINEHELSRRTKIRQPIIHRLLSGENKNPKLQTIKPIADYFLLTVSQLIGEEISSTWSGYTNSNHHGLNQVPFLDNLGNYVNKKPIVTECNVSKDAFAFLISDSTMAPIFPENSIVIIEPNSIPESGDYVVLKNSKNELILRNLLIISGKKYITSMTNNRQDSIHQIPNNEKILGVVIRTIYDHKLV